MEWDYKRQTKETTTGRITELMTHCVQILHFTEQSTAKHRVSATGFVLATGLKYVRYPMRSAAKPLKTLVVAKKKNVQL